MDNIKETLIKRAKSLYGKITPCSNKKSFQDCFTQNSNGEISLWFNSEDNSTHMLRSNDIECFDVFTLKRES